MSRPTRFNPAAGDATCRAGQTRVVPYEVHMYEYYRRPASCSVLCLATNGNRNVRKAEVDAACLLVGSQRGSRC